MLCPECSQSHLESNYYNPNRLYCDFCRMEFIEKDDGRLMLLTYNDRYNIMKYRDRMKSLNAAF